VITPSDKETLQPPKTLGLQADSGTCVSKYMRFKVHAFQSALKDKR